MNTACGIAPQHQLTLEQCHADRVVAQIIDLRDRMPVCGFDHRC
jgi:hypothetical protein